MVNVVIILTLSLSVIKGNYLKIDVNSLTNTRMVNSYSGLFTFYFLKLCINTIEKMHFIHVKHIVVPVDAIFLYQ